MIPLQDTRIKDAHFVAFTKLHKEHHDLLTYNTQDITNLPLRLIDQEHKNTVARVNSVKRP
jgi:hypothetical protein